MSSVTSQFSFSRAGIQERRGARDREKKKPKDFEQLLGPHYQTGKRAASYSTMWRTMVTFLHHIITTGGEPAAVVDLHTGQTTCLVKLCKCNSAIQGTSTASKRIFSLAGKSIRSLHPNQFEKQRAANRLLMVSLQTWSVSEHCFAIAALTCVFLMQHMNWSSMCCCCCD